MTTAHDSIIQQYLKSRREGDVKTILSLFEEGNEDVFIVDRNSKKHQGIVAIEKALSSETPTIDLNSLSLTFIEDRIIVASFKVTAFWMNFNVKARFSFGNSGKLCSVETLPK